MKESLEAETSVDNRKAVNPLVMSLKETLEKVTQMICESHLNKHSDY
jgi:hypothetical protein